jgi:hypothetical protein
MLDTLESFAVELDPVQVSAELDDLNRFLGDNEMIYPEDPEDLASFRSWLAARPDTIVALVDAHRDRCVAWAASRWTGWPMEQGDCTSLPVDTGWNDTGGVPIPIDKPAVP